jgi:hypothetical protein
MTKATEAQRFLAERRTDYIRTFDTPFGAKVLADLAKFCRAQESTFHPDARVHAVAEGRREVWLRIQQHLNLSDEDLWRAFGGAPVVISKNPPQE